MYGPIFIKIVLIASLLSDGFMKHSLHAQHNVYWTEQHAQIVLLLPSDFCTSTIHILISNAPMLELEHVGACCHLPLLLSPL